MQNSAGETHATSIQWLQKQLQEIFKATCISVAVSPTEPLQLSPGVLSIHRMAAV